MTVSTLTAYQVENARTLLQKLDGVSPETRNFALAMCSFFVDGMMLQEHLSEQAREPTERQAG